MIKHTKFFEFIFILLLFCSPPPKGDTKIAEQNMKMFDTSLTALYLPLEKITLSMVPDKDLAALKKANPLYLFAKKQKVSQSSNRNDSFYIEMANELALNEISRHYKAISYKPDTNDTIQNDSMFFSLQACWSQSVHDTGSFVKKIAEKHRVDLVIIPGDCSIKEAEIQTTGWRDNKYGKYYDKPSTVNATALFQVQIWDKNGRMQYERKGTGISKRPVLYEALKRDQPQNQSLGDYSKNVFAPTLVRALGEACRKAFVNDK